MQAVQQLRQPLSDNIVAERQLLELAMLCRRHMAVLVLLGVEVAAQDSMAYSWSGQKIWVL